MNDDTHAILALDPGGTTGVAAGYVELRQMRRETLETMRSHKTTEVKGNWLEQARLLGEIMSKFVFTANVENSIPLDNIHIAIEDFVLRRREEGGATGNLISCWVAAGAVAMFVSHAGSLFEGIEVHDDSMISWQTASDAKHVANNERLKSYGLWVVGSAHERDANRHLVLRVDKLL